MLVIILCFVFEIMRGLSTGAEDREYWVKIAVQLAEPILVNLANNTLKKNMPYESLAAASDRQKFSHLEAVGRILSGIAPWLELGPDDTAEGKIRGTYIDLTLKGLANAVNPDSPDYLNFNDGSQPLVDASLLTFALLRAPTQLWGKLDDQTKQRLIAELKSSRVISPVNNNWRLFSSMVEAFFLVIGEEHDEKRLMDGVNVFRNDWYKGDSLYGDGPNYAQDYYNSFVIHPYFTHILTIFKNLSHEAGDFLDTQVKRHTRYAAILERFISPEGTYPVVGRSITYRFGAFHALTDAALRGILPSEVTPAQVRCALTAVIKRLATPAIFDEDGWLRVGFGGSQLNMSETYINTGSLYWSANVFVPLGLPPTHKFWSDPYTEWTTIKAYAGKEVHADHAI